MSKELLIESTDFSLTESKVEQGTEKDRKYIIEGIFLQSSVKNGNGRIYPEDVMDRAVKIYMDKYFYTNRAVGELEHPDDKRTQQIMLKGISHKITKLEKNGTDWYGRAEITKNTKNGAIVCGLMDAGIQLGTSSRATGTTRKQGSTIIVQNDFRIITPSDIVYEPSAPDALVNSIMESKTWLIEDGVLVERQLDQIQNQVNNSIKHKKFDAQELFASILSIAQK